MQNRSLTLTISFTSLQPNWPFLDFKLDVSPLTHFLILEQQLTKHHGCIKNLKLFYDSQKKKQVSYKLDEIIGQKVDSCDKVVSTGPQNKQVTIYYQYQNGYQWPLLSF